MIVPRRDKDRHHDRNRKYGAWLTFNPEDRSDRFAEGFGALQNLSECRLAPGTGIPSQAYREAELVTYVRQGALAHHESRGRSGVIQAGEFQRLSAGRGVRRSETNASTTDLTQFFKVQIRPSEAELEPTHEQKRFSAGERRGAFCVVASPDCRRGSLRLRQDALLYSAMLQSGQHLVHPLAEWRGAWLHLVHGEVTLDDLVLTTGDGAGVTGERSVSLTAQEESEVLLVDVSVVQASASGTGGVHER